MKTIPLFPLPAVLFPGGRLPLKIFEQRYIDMVRECSAAGSRFGVCLTRGDEHVKASAAHRGVGTTAEICDFTALDGGLLGIVARGCERFVVNRTWKRDNGLLMADVRVLPESPGIEVPEQYSLLSLVAQRIMEQVGGCYPSYRPSDLQDADWLGYRLAELLPLDNDERHALLQITEPLQRLQALLELLPRFQGPAGVR